MATSQKEGGNRVLWASQATTLQLSHNTLLYLGEGGCWAESGATAAAGGFSSQGWDWLSRIASSNLAACRRDFWSRCCRSAMAGFGRVSQHFTS
jgi:hypothetical protein